MAAGDDSGDWLAIRRQELPVGEILAWVASPSCGALAVFCGTVRDHSEGRPGVARLDYEAYPEQAEARLAEIARTARQRWLGIGRLALVHRVGECPVGATVVVVAVSTPHRAEAFEACRWCIDTLKAAVPIWKHEVWADGAGWGLFSHDLAAVGDLAAVDAAAPDLPTEQRG